MPQPLSLQQWADRIMPELNPLLWEEFDQYQDDPEYNWVGKVYNIKGTQRWYNEFSSQQRARDWPLLPDETESFPIYEWDAPTDLTFNLQAYGMGFKITDRMIRYGGDPYVHIMASFAEFKRDFMEGGLRAHNKRAGEVLLDAFDGDILTTSDGFPLCYDAHTHAAGSATYDNLLTKKLTASGALDDAFALNSVLELADQHGNPLFFRPNVLVCSQMYEKAAYELIANTVKPGATNAEGNYYNTIIEKVVVCPWFNNAVKTGSQHYWFLMDSRKHGLTGLVGTLPHMIESPKVDNRSAEFDGLTEFEYFYKRWEGVVGSTGAA